ncbi:MAG: dTDP-glucose 4,6-dehydratase [Pseudomonadota bacterium]|nr:dTDP-glucose 4,6-dehydratase [Pseudomonadota bacterium]
MANSKIKLIKWDAKVLVTGGAGFIGSALVRALISKYSCEVVTVDKLGYASAIEGLAEVMKHPRHRLEVLDITDQVAIDKFIKAEKPDVIFHLAAETHVDRSIDSPNEFFRSNILGSFCLLESVRSYLSTVSGKKLDKFRFLHVSTDEVFGSLGFDGSFSEDSPYNPTSPYSATKASADHLARAWYNTYRLPIVLTHCTNNYGPFQFPEKLVPLMVSNAILGLPLTSSGDGLTVREWIHVEDHERGLICVTRGGELGQSYNIGAREEINNLNLVNLICDILDEILPRAERNSYKTLIQLVEDRPCHDRRYSINTEKIKVELGWQPTISLKSGLRETIQWYTNNREWSDKIRDNVYKGERLGLKAGRS